MHASMCACTHLCTHECMMKISWWKYQVDGVLKVEKYVLYYLIPFLALELVEGLLDIKDISSLTKMDIEITVKRLVITQDKLVVYQQHSNYPHSENSNQLISLAESLAFFPRNFSSQNEAGWFLNNIRGFDCELPLVL